MTSRDVPAGRLPPVPGLHVLLVECGSDQVNARSQANVCVQRLGEVIKSHTVGSLTIPSTIFNWYNYGNYVHTF